MGKTAHGDPVFLDLSSKEAWVAHAAVLDALDRAVETGDTGETLRREVGLLEAIEGDQAFTSDELRLLGEVVRTYLEEAPVRDRETILSILTTIRTALN